MLFMSIILDRTMKYNSFTKHKTCKSMATANSFPYKGGMHMHFLAIVKCKKDWGKHKKHSHIKHNSKQQCNS